MRDIHEAVRVGNDRRDTSEVPAIRQPVGPEAGVGSHLEQAAFVRLPGGR